MKKPVFLVVIAALAIVGLSAVFLGCEPTKKPSLRVGVVLPLSGGMAEFGENARNGLVLAQEELARDGFQIELVVQNSEDVSDGTVAAVRRLVDVESVQFIIGGLTSSGVLAAAPYAQKKGVLFFTPAASAPGIPEIGSLVLRNWPSDTALASLYGAWGYESLGARAVKILHVSNDYGKTNATAFKTRFEELGGKVTMVSAFPQGESDFRNALTELRAGGPSDAVMVIAYPDEYRGIFQALNSQPLGGMLLATDTFYTPELLTQIGPASEGVYCAAASKPGDDYAPRKEYYRKYRQRFTISDGKPREPGLVSDTAYDALHLIADGVRVTDGSPTAVSDWLLKLRNYQGAVGPTQFTATGDFESGLSVFRVQRGSFVQVTGKQ